MSGCGYWCDKRYGNGRNDGVSMGGNVNNNGCASYSGIRNSSDNSEVSMGSNRMDNNPSTMMSAIHCN